MTAQEEIRNLKLRIRALDIEATVAPMTPMEALMRADLAARLEIIQGRKGKAMPYTERDIAYFDGMDEDEPLEEENADDKRDRLEALEEDYWDGIKPDYWNPDVGSVAVREERRMAEDFGPEDTIAEWKGEK